MHFKQNEEQQFVEKLLQEGVGTSIAKGELVYRCRTKPKGLYFLKTGLVGLFRLSVNGQENLLRLFKPGQFFGHRSLFSDECYHASAKCLESSQVVLIPQNKVEELFSQQPQAYFYLARALAKELRRAEVRSVLVSEGNVMERVSSALLLFKSLYPQHLWTRAEIANFCASRTPTVIKALGFLEKQGVIKQNGRQIEIVDHNKLLDFID